MAKEFMSDDNFNELLESVKEAVAIDKGKIAPARIFTVTPVDVVEVRTQTHKTQKEFADMIGISVGTLRNWEQGRRRPTGAAVALLKVISANPQYVKNVLR